MDLYSVADQIAEPYDNLRRLSEMYADHQAERLRQLGRIRSFTVMPATYAAYAVSMKELETKLSKDLIAAYQVTAPVGVIAWQKASLGIGPHMLARLLGNLGHPRLATPHYQAVNDSLGDDEFGDEENPKRRLEAGEPFIRSIGQLWQFCGHGAPIRKYKGMPQEDALALGRPKCKMLVHLIAGAIVQASSRTAEDGSKYALSPYGQFYLDTKAKYANRPHLGPCSGGYVGAGPGKVVFAKCKVVIDGKKRYADAGDPFSPGHVNAIALRHLGKEVLRDLWIASDEGWDGI